MKRTIYLYTPTSARMFAGWLARSGRCFSIVVWCNGSTQVGKGQSLPTGDAGSSPATATKNLCLLGTNREVREHIFL